MATKKKRKKLPGRAPVRARGQYRRDLTGPVRYVRTRAEVDDLILAVHPTRTAADAYRVALEAWAKFRDYLRANPPTNPELDHLLGDAVP